MTDIPSVPYAQRSTMAIEIEQEIKRLQTTRQKISADELGEIQRMEGLVKREYKQPLSVFVAVYMDVEAIGFDLENRYYRRAYLEQDYEFVAFQVLFGRALLTTREIRTLLATGLATGAIARWRTLYELYITARFLYANRNHPDEIAKRYYSHRFISRLQLKELQHEALELASGPQPVSQDVVALRSHCDALIKEYDDSFAKHYGWASAAIITKKGIPHPQPTFEDIEKTVSDVALKPWYRYASWVNHAASVGNTDNLQKLATDQVAVIGQSIAGFKNPAWLTLRALLQIAVLYAELKNPDHYCPRLQALYEVAEQMRDQLDDADKRMDERNPHGLKWKR